MDYTNEILTTRQMIKVAAESRNRRMSEIAEMLGVSRSGFSNRLREDNFRTRDLEKIANFLDYDLVITFRDRKGETAKNS